MTDVCYFCCMSPRLSRVFISTEQDDERISGSEMTATVDRPPSTSQQPHSIQTDITETQEPDEYSETITQLHAAAVNGDKQYLARLLTAYQRLIDNGDQFGRNPLIFCILADRFDCAELLLKWGSNINHKDKGGRTPLHWAAHKGNYRLMKLLLTKGAGWYEEDNEGQTALHLCTRHKQPKCMSLLLRHLSPAEVDVQDNNKRTALHWASSYGNFEHVKMLIKQDSNIGIPDIDGKTPLHWAASSQDKQAVNCVKVILETTPSVINWQDFEGRTALHLAVADGNESIVNILTSVPKCDVSALDNMFRTPLHWAAVLGHSKIVGILLEKGADYTNSDSNGATPLHYAAQNNFSCSSFPEAHALESKQQCIWTNDIPRSWTTAQAYCQQYDGSLVQIINGRDKIDFIRSLNLNKCSSFPEAHALESTQQCIWTNDIPRSWTTAQAYCQQYDGSLVQIINGRDKIDFIRSLNLRGMYWLGGSDLEEQGQWKWLDGSIIAVSDTRWAPNQHLKNDEHCLMISANQWHDEKCDDKETVDVFLSFINVTDDMYDNERRTAFMWAAGKGADNVINVFHKHRVDLQQADKNGATALHAAALSGHESTVKLLLVLGAHIDVEDHLHHTPLFRACEMGHTEVVRCLLDMCSKVDTVDQEGRSTLHWAALGGHAYICQILINHEVDPNVRDFAGRTPLQCAAYGGYVNCMSVLIENNAQPNAQDNEGMTPLHWACSKGDLDGVKLLLENNAYPNQMEYTEDRYTPLDYALMGEHHDVAQYMIEQDALSITGIQDIAAQKIQSSFRGYRVRKTFTERKILLMKHEKLKKEAARKRAGTIDEGKKKEDKTNKLETDYNILTSEQCAINIPLVTETLIVDDIRNIDISKTLECCNFDTPKTLESCNVDQLKTLESSNADIPKTLESRNANIPKTLESRNIDIQSCNNNIPKTFESCNVDKPKTLERIESRIEVYQNVEEKKQDDSESNCDAPSLEKNENESIALQLSQLAIHSNSKKNKCSVADRRNTNQNLSKTLNIQLEKQNIDPKINNRRVISGPAIFKTNSEFCKNAEITATESTFELEMPSILKTSGISSVASLPIQKLEIENQDILAHKQEAQRIKITEKNRRREIHRKQKAAHTIQRAWRRYKHQKFQLMDTAKRSIRLKRLHATKEEWQEQIAALTIQLAWRKYYRHKLLKAIKPNKHLLRSWDPDIIAAKQQTLMRQIYDRQRQAVSWHPKPRKPVRPEYLQYMPSHAAISYNFALSQYHPLYSSRTPRPSTYSPSIVDSSSCSSVRSGRSSVRSSVRSSSSKLSTGSRGSKESLRSRGSDRRSHGNKDSTHGSDRGSDAGSVSGRGSDNGDNKFNGRGGDGLGDKGGNKNGNNKGGNTDDKGGNKNDKGGNKNDKGGIKNSLDNKGGNKDNKGGNKDDRGGNKNSLDNKGGNKDNKEGNKNGLGDNKGDNKDDKGDNMIDKGGNKFGNDKGGNKNDKGGNKNSLDNKGGNKDNKGGNKDDRGGNKDDNNKGGNKDDKGGNKNGLGDNKGDNTDDKRGNKNDRGGNKDDKGGNKNGDNKGGNKDDRGANKNGDNKGGNKDDKEGNKFGNDKEGNKNGDKGGNKLGDNKGGDKDSLDNKGGNKNERGVDKLGDDKGGNMDDKGGNMDDKGGNKESLDNKGGNNDNKGDNKNDRGGNKDDMEDNKDQDVYLSDASSRKGNDKSWYGSQSSIASSRGSDSNSHKSSQSSLNYSDTFGSLGNIAEKYLSRSRSRSSSRNRSSSSSSNHSHSSRSSHSSNHSSRKSNKK